MANDRLYVLGRLILEEAEDALGSAGRDLPARRYVHFGLIAYDCDQLTVTLVRVFPGRPGQEGIGLEHRRGCVDQRTAEYALELVRCVPSSAPGGESPTAAALDASGLDILTDSFILLRGLAESAGANAFSDACDDVAIGTLSYIGSEGGMVGVRIPVQILVE